MEQVRLLKMCFLSNHLQQSLDRETIQKNVFIMLLKMIFYHNFTHNLPFGRFKQTSRDKLNEIHQHLITADDANLWGGINIKKKNMEALLDASME